MDWLVVFFLLFLVLFFVYGVFKFVCFSFVFVFVIIFYNLEVVWFLFMLLGRILFINVFFLFVCKLEEFILRIKILYLDGFYYCVYIL